jgi:hypothetical protein
MNVLVIFSSSTGATEELALAAAVGAVQARANIRLRRLTDQDTGSGESVVRMRREYVPPTAADSVWADAIIIGINRKLCGAALDRDQAVAFGRRVGASTNPLSRS